MNNSRFIDQRMNKFCTAEGSSLFSWLDGSTNQFQSHQKNVQICKKISSHLTARNSNFLFMSKQSMQNLGLTSQTAHHINCLSENDGRN